MRYGTDINKMDYEYTFKCYLGDQIKVDEMESACNIHGRYEECE
jgi:hypothetical protein